MAENSSGPEGIGPGTILNGTYRIERLIGSGGMGDVYLATNIELDEQDAVKVIKEQWATEPKIATLLRKEAKTLRLLVAPEVALFRACATDPDLNALYLVTEYVAGQSLANRINGVPTPVEDVLVLLKRVATGLKAAHDLNIVHRDISPDNILLPERRFDRAKIIDFGIAKDLGPGAETVIGEGFAGRWDYSAPELFSAGQTPVGPWSDIYSLGLVALALAKGAPANMGSTMPSAYAARQREVDLEGVPHALQGLLADMLHPDYRERIQSMGELLRLIKAVDAHAQPAPAAPPKPSADEALDETIVADETALASATGRSTAPPQASPEKTQAAPPPPPPPPPPAPAPERQVQAQVPPPPPAAPPHQPAGPTEQRSTIPLVVGGIAALLLPIGLWLSWPGSEQDASPVETSAQNESGAAGAAEATAAALKANAEAAKSGYRSAADVGPIDVPLKMIGRWARKPDYPNEPDCANATLIARLPGAISIIGSPGRPPINEQITSASGADQINTETKIYSLQDEATLFITRKGIRQTLDIYKRCT